MHRAHRVAGDRHAVAADLHHQPRGEGECPAPGLGVGDHEPGEHHRVVRARSAGERAAVPRQQRRGQHRDLLAHHPDIHPPLGQVTPVHLDRGAGLADAVQHGQQHVQVVDDLVPVGQERPHHPRPVRRRRAQAAEQELAVVALQPGVDVRVVQARLVLAQPPQVGGRDAELVRDPLVAHLGRGVGAGGHRHPVRAQHRIGARHDQPGALGADRGRRGNEVGLAGLLVTQQRSQIGQCRVARTQRCHAGIGTHQCSPSCRSVTVPGGTAPPGSQSPSAARKATAHRAGPGGQDVSPAGTEPAPAKPAPEPKARGQGKDLCPPG